MRLLFLTDTHHRGTTPQNRLDNFPDTQREKVQEVVDLIREHQVDLVLHGGDFWDSPFPALNVCAEVLETYRAIPVPIYGIAGNHDLYGHNLGTLHRTMLGFMDRLGLIRLLNPGERVYIEKKGLRLQLTGQPYHYDMDRRDPVLDYCITKEDCDVAVHIVHGLLADRSLGSIIQHTVVDRVLSTEADLTLVGHYHLGFSPVEYRGRYFFNPGALVRVNNHPQEMARQPAVLLLDLGGGEVKYSLLPLRCARPGEEVLDRSKVELQERREERLAEFVREVAAAGQYYGANLEEMVAAIADKETLPPEVRQEALRRLARAQEAFLAGEVGE
ncbi:MAG: metallophosphoesterase [bacterium]|nr:metallophosphoesterase family protein [Bacillota bacterium]HHW54145.1 serine/threonine protein phosphatase [Bacillota bacterium]